MKKNIENEVGTVVKYVCTIVSLSTVIDRCWVRTARGCLLFRYDILWLVVLGGFGHVEPQQA